VECGPSPRRLEQEWRDSRPPQLVRSSERDVLRETDESRDAFGRSVSAHPHGEGDMATAMRRLLLTAVLACMATTATAATNGEVRQNADGAAEIWDATSQDWVGADVFWERFALAQGGLTWGRGSIYPPYEKVKERDLFLVEVEQGPCLMEFFHGRWRRANDVRRWNDAINEVAGCAHVFAK